MSREAPIFLDATFSGAEIAGYYDSRVPALKRGTRAERRGPCPIHRGNDDNFTVNMQTGLWFCHSQCARGGDILALEQALTGADFRTAMETVYGIVGRPIPGREPLTRDEWQARQQDRRQAELEQSTAGYFADAAIILAEQALEELEPCDPERAIHTHLLKRLRENPVAVYCWWCRNNPEGAAALVEAGLNHQRRLQRLLLAFVKTISPETETNVE